MYLPTMQDWENKFKQIGDNFDLKTIDYFSNNYYNRMNWGGEDYLQVAADIKFHMLLFADWCEEQNKIKLATRVRNAAKANYLIGFHQDYGFRLIGEVSYTMHNIVARVTLDAPNPLETLFAKVSYAHRLEAGIDMDDYELIRGEYAIYSDHVARSI